VLKIETLLKIGSSMVVRESCWYVRIKESPRSSSHSYTSALHVRFLKQYGGKYKSMVVRSRYRGSPILDEALPLLYSVTGIRDYVRILSHWMTIMLEMLGFSSKKRTKMNSFGTLEISVAINDSSWDQEGVVLILERGTQGSGPSAPKRAPPLKVGWPLVTWAGLAQGTFRCAYCIHKEPCP